MPELRFAIGGERRLGERRHAIAGIVSAASHAAFALIAVLLVRASAPGRGPVVATAETSAKIVFVPDPGPGGGGGGGGNHDLVPPRRVELPGSDPTTMPVARAVSFELSPPRQEPDPVETLQIPAIVQAADHAALPGAIDGPPAPPTVSQGPGSGRGAGTGNGAGIGPGDGDGLGPGRGGNTGGGIYTPGGGVTQPRVLKEVKPQYTADAMRAKVQGTVLVVCVVRADGTISDVRVARSLDPTFGLDAQAIAAVKQWRFAPATMSGEPVAVRITIELTFTLR